MPTRSSLRSMLLGTRGHSLDESLRQAIAPADVIYPRFKKHELMQRLRRLADVCRLLLYDDADFAGNSADLSKSTSGVFLVMAGPSAFARLLAASRAQSATSHFSTESEVISLEYAVGQLSFSGMPLHLFFISTHASTSRSSRVGGTLATQPGGK